MISRLFRFHGYGSLKFVYSKGASVRSRFISLKYLKNPRRGSSRLAVVVSKKVTKRAPQRNRIRRRLYEAMRQQWPELKQPHDMVLTVFDNRVGSMPAEELEKLVCDLLRQADLYAK